MQESLSLSSLLSSQSLLFNARLSPEPASQPLV
jgi:hypothetical protein